MSRLLRLIFLPIGLAVAFFAFVNAASEIGALPIGSAAHSGWFGLNGHILSLLAESGFRKELASQESQVERGEIPRLSDGLIAAAKASYAVNPLDVSSLRTIALGGILQDDKNRARQIMRVAEQISKRDSIVDLWLARDYGELGDTQAMLASFDHALRTSISVRQAAMKPVVAALADPASFAPLGKLLKLRPEWEGGFWREFVRNPASVAHSASFLASTDIPLDHIPDYDRQVLYHNLKRTNQFEVLSRLAVLDPDIKASSKALAAGRFVTVERGDPFAWALHTKGSAAARVLPDWSVLEIDAQPGSFGTAADRTVRLSGPQVLAIKMFEPLPTNATLDLAVDCADGTGAGLAEVRLRGGENGGRASFAPDGCAYGTLRLSFAVDEGRRPALIRVASVTLHGT
jgi:hypothetical protein